MADEEYLFESAGELGVEELYDAFDFWHERKSYVQISFILL